MITNKRQILRWTGVMGAGIAFAFLAGCSGGGDTSGTAAPPSGAASSGAPGGAGSESGGSMAGGSGPMMAGSGPMMGGSGSMMGGGGSMMGGSGPGMSGGGAAARTASTSAPPPGGIPSHRPDPFRPWWDNTPKPPPVLSFVAPVRIAIRDSGALRNQPGIEIKEVPNQRVAGILSGNGVYALLDGPEGQTVVKPGDEVGEYRVASINPDSVVLKREVKTGQFKQTYTQVVPLTDVGSNTGVRMGGPGMIGGSGMMGGPPGGMFPGMGGGGKMGGGRGGATE